MAKITEPGISASFGSHLPILRAAVVATEGPILELGGGLFSTEYLDSLNRQGSRLVVTVEKNPDWRLYLEEHWPNHTYVDTNPNHGGWSVVLVDNGDAGDWYDTRWREVELYKDKAEFILLHDAVPFGEEINGDAHRKVAESFKYHTWYTPTLPMTLVLSDTRETWGLE